MANNTITGKFRETFDATPRNVRWMLLAVAFVVVLVLLFLLMHKKKTPDVQTVQQNRIVELNIVPRDADFSDTEIGEKAKQVFKISASDNAVIDSVMVQKTVSGFSAQTSGCKNQPVNQDIACKIDVAFAPKNTDAAGDVILVVEWHDMGDSREINPQSTNIIIPVSTKAPVVAQPAPVESEPDIDFSDTPTPSQPNNSGVIGAGDNIFRQDLPEPEPVFRRAERCSDFTMPGYNVSGVQIGWIKPNGGRYEFHPYSDVDCNNPTGIYNPDTGIITDESGRKIGTDADHIKLSFDENTVPALKSKPSAVAARGAAVSGGKLNGMGNLRGTFSKESGTAGMHFKTNEIDKKALQGSAQGPESVYSSRPYDRTFILRQFKPIPATIVSEVRADPSIYGCKTENGKTKCDGGGIPVRATVDRNVYSDNGRTIILPTGTLLLGYLKGELPGPYKTIGRMQINWYQFIRPDGVEFNFGTDQDPYSGDSQGRVGVPGYGSTDYIEQMVMPLLTAIIPAAVNMIAPIADTFVNQIDLDNNTVVQSGTVRSSELAKNEVISAWNQVAQKLIVDALDNTVPPFSIAAGTRITVYSPVDLIATCGDGTTDGETANAGKKCAFHPYNEQTRRKWSDVNNKIDINLNDPSWTGQVRSFNLGQYCVQDSKGVWTVDSNKALDISNAGYDYRTVLAYCQSQNYQAINQAKYDAYYQKLTSNGPVNTVTKNQDGTISTQYNNQTYNEQVLGLQYDENGNIKNPFEKTNSSVQETPVPGLDCDGVAPDQYGCCPGETYTDMGDQGFNCCPDNGGDCFPPFDVN